MTRNLLDELARREIPPPPRNLSSEVHRRINSRLVFRHIVDFVVYGLAYALLHFLQALLGASWFTITGSDLTPPLQFPNQKEPDDE